MRFAETQGGPVKALTFVVLAAALATAAYGQDQEKKLSRSEAMSAVASKVDPEYPPMAKQLRISGAVELEAVVSESGAVEKVTIVSGNPVLTKAGADALMKWKFKPITADGKPVKALAPVTFDFK
jgi:TonB family protein